MKDRSKCTRNRDTRRAQASFPEGISGQFASESSQTASTSVCLEANCDVRGKHDGKTIRGRFLAESGGGMDGSASNNGQDVHLFGRSYDLSKPTARGRKGVRIDRNDELGRNNIGQTKRAVDIPQTLRSRAR